MRIAIIPARGGSKRIPHKNIIDFFGKPMIAWTIEAALKSRLFDKVVVNTDSQAIADIACRYGAEVPLMRKVFADDMTPISQVTIHAIEELKTQLNWDIDSVVQLMANCPLRQEKHIIESVEHFMAHGLDFQLSACKFGWLNPWWAVELDASLAPKPLFDQALKQRSQDLKPLFCPSGAIWIAKVDALLRDQSFYGTNHKFFPIDWRAAVDIDDREDLDFAQGVYLSMQQHTGDRK